MPSHRLSFSRFAIILAAGILLLIVMIWALVLGDRKSRELGLEYEAYRSSTAIIEAYRNGEAASARSGFLGFGLYGGNGLALLREGSAPDYLDLARLMATPAVVERSGNSLTVRRLIGGQPMGGMMGMGQGRRRAGAFPGGPGSPLPGMSGPGAIVVGESLAQALYLEYSLPGGLGPERVSFLIAGLVSMALCLLYVLLLGSFRRNEELRNRELRNRELVELGEAARTLAHEIKNPLAIVRIQTASLRRAATAPAAVKEALEAKVLAGVEIIDEELRRLAGLSDRIRDFLKGGTGDARELELAPFLAALSARYAAEQPPLLLLPVPAGARVFADPERLSLALDNLLRNAEEAAPGQSTELWVEGRGKHWAIVVADRGPGVPEELRERVFELFYTSKSGGSGIGLALARRIAEAAGGRLSCAAREGGGSLFVLSLPAFAAGAARAPDPLHA